MTGGDVLGGRYELRGLLGSGGMAEVRDAWDTRLGRPVAIKMLHPVLGAKPDALSRFEDEARAAGRLQHPNIVAVHDYGHHGPTPYIVMERLPGTTLEDEISRGPLPPMRVRSILDDVLAALATAHAAGVVHRDIKPANVLSSGHGGAVKVADFGIAKTADVSHTATGQLVGTMAYTSPERLSGAASSVSDDLYAVGVVGYELATGRRPFPQDDVRALAVAILDGSHAPLATTAGGVDPVVAEVIERAIARDPRVRFTSAAQMRAALAGPRPATRAFTAPFVPAVSNAYPRRVEGRWPRRRLVLATIGALVALVVTVVAVAMDSSSTKVPATTGTTVTTPSVTTPSVTSSPPLTSTTPPPTTPTTPTVVAPIEPQRPAPGNGNGNGKGPKNRHD